MPAGDPKAGDRYVVRQPFEAIVLVMFFAPFTDGATRLLPVGLEFEIWRDPAPAARGLNARPIDPEKWESQLVSLENRSDKKYGGFSISIMKADLATKCAKVR